jgi:hypothetical protein
MNIHYCAQSSSGLASNNVPNTITSEASTHWMDVPPDYPFHFFRLIQKTNSELYAQCSTVPFFLSVNLTQNTSNKDANDSGFSNFLTVNYGKYSLWLTFSLLSAHTSLRTQPFVLLNFFCTLNAYIIQNTPTNN